MISLVENAYAKINLYLDVVRKKDDGYHDILSVMQAVSLYDRIKLTKSAVYSDIVVLSSSEKLPQDPKQNLVYRAADLFFEKAGKSERGFVIEIEKNIPVSAGLAGGSSDAAAVLRAMNELTGAGLSLIQLAKIGERVGSDVPYCVLGGTALAEGRGEILTPLPSLPHCWVAVCKPAFPISTPQLFGRVDVRKIVRRPDTAGVMEALSAGDLLGVSRRLYNVFEDVLEPRRKAEIDSIKSAMIDCGALGASMSGSGPTVFGLFDDRACAREACDRLSGLYKNVFLTETV